MYSIHTYHFDTQTKRQHIPAVYLHNVFFYCCENKWRVWCTIFVFAKPLLFSLWAQTDECVQKCPCFAGGSWFDDGYSFTRQCKTKWVLPQRWGYPTKKYTSLSSVACHVMNSKSVRRGRVTHSLETLNVLYLCHSAQILVIYREG